MEWWEKFAGLLELQDSIEDVSIFGMGLRTVLVYLVALVLVRVGSRRLLAKPSAFDVIVAIMVGSILSRAINGSAPMLPTLVAGAVLLAMHELLAIVAVHTNWFGPVVKGEAVLLIRDGEIQAQALRETDLTEEDLIEALRLEIRDEDPAKVRRAYLERNGKISVIPYSREQGGGPGASG